MVTEAQRRANKKFYEAHKHLPEFKEKQREYHRAYYKRRLTDPTNRAMVDAIKDYLEDHGLKQKGLALIAGISVKRIQRATAYATFINPEEYAAVPELYAKLTNIYKEGHPEW